jgi:class 3 adenylate cyclase
VAGGLPVLPNPDHAAAALVFAVRLHAVASRVLDPQGRPLRMRVGVHSGRVMSGVCVGAVRARYTLFGEGITTALRMEESSEPGRTHASAATVDLLHMDPRFEFQFRGCVVPGGRASFYVDQAAAGR